MKRRIKAYMTIEASFIIPVILMILCLIIYWTFYLYNRCVVYQDCYISALRGTQLLVEETGNIIVETEKNAIELLSNQLYQYQITPTVSISSDQITVKAVSNITIMSTSIIVFRKDELTTNREATAIRINPTKLIRMVY